MVCGFYRDAHGRGYTRTDLAWGVRRQRDGVAAVVVEEALGGGESR